MIGIIPRVRLISGVFHTMISLRTLPTLLVCLLLASCASVSLAPQGSPSIVLAQDETRACGQAQILFPKGEYKAEVVSPHGTYYKAPQRLRTTGVLIGRPEVGGIFVSNAAGNAQAAWFGEPRQNVGENPDTLFGAIGLNAPKLRPYTPSIPFTLKK